MTEASHSALSHKETDRLFVQSYERLKQYFRRKTGSMDEAEDLTQELFLRITARTGQAEVRHPEAYLFISAANLLRDRARRLRTRRSALGGDEASVCSLALAVGDDLTPERILDGRNSLDQVLRLIEQLSDRTKAIFVLHRLEHLSQREISVRLNISVSAVEKHVSKALSHIAINLER